MTEAAPGKRGRRPVRNAAAEYEKRRGRKAVEDALWGLVFAVEVELARWMVEFVRSAAFDRGEDSRPWPPLPVWCRSTLLWMGIRRTRGAPVPPFVREIPSAVLIQICHDPPAPALRSLLDLQRAAGHDPRRLEESLNEATRHAMRLAGLGPDGRIESSWSLLAPLLSAADTFSTRAHATAQAKWRPAHRPAAETLRAFHKGISLRFAQLGEQLRPSDLALLAVTAGLETLDPNLDRLTMRWRDRCRSWARKRSESRTPDNGGENSSP